MAMAEYVIRKFDGDGRLLGARITEYLNDEKATVLAAGLMKMPVRRLEVWQGSRQVAVITVG